MVPRAARARGARVADGDPGRPAGGVRARHGAAALPARRRRRTVR